VSLIASCGIYADSVIWSQLGVFAYRAPFAFAVEIGGNVFVRAYLTFKMIFRTGRLNLA